ncbi:hypothetical protein AWB83_07036 [Caballeronia ptereochthonis]|uniref:Tash protein PEST motif family protein n=1 Tax=Caballeronia ptereochthonis TaxID=1777144 RepID=A0A158EF90_9BURK|nr:hypothetical protein AWB83_07036 [Caballeronia ptereochthonis]
MPPLMLVIEPATFEISDVFWLIAWSAAYSCEPFTASVELALTRPAATLVIVRSLPAAPTDTVLVALLPANVYAVPPIVALVVFTTAAVVEPAPSATSPLLVDTAPEPIATESTPVAVESTPVLFAWKYFVPVLYTLLI